MVFWGNSKERKARVYVESEANFAQALHWHGRRIDNSFQLKGDKVSVAGILCNWCFEENRFRKQDVFGFLESALKKGVVSKQDIIVFLDGQGGVYVGK